ncbi:MAG: YitT family protein [Oscillospiraceae bacterium]
MLKKTVVREILRYLAIAAGCALFALGFNLFQKPYGIVPGGVSGVSMLLNFIFGKPSIGSIIIIINIPLFIAGFFVLGKRFIVSTVFGTLASSFLIDLFAFLPRIDTEPILAAVYGGLIGGAGMGIIFFFEGTTGGVDIAASLIRHRYPSAKMGRIIFCFDSLVVISSAIVFNSISAAMYAIVTLYISSITADSILYGSQNARIAYIICSRPRELAAAIIERLERGVTIIHGEGAYTGEDRQVLLCAVKRRQVTKLRKLVHEFDKNAFLILSNANEVFGEGFSD